MTKKKSRSSKKRRTPKRQSTHKSQLIKIVTGFFILIALVVVAGLLTHHLLIRNGKVPTTKVQRPVSEQKPATRKDPEPQVRAEHQPRMVDDIPPYPFEIFPPPEKTEPQEPPPPEKPKKVLPRVALIIDDVGHNKRMAEGFLKLDAVLTLAIFPHSPHRKTIARMAADNGTEIMLHLPMEPMGYPKYDPGPGVLLSSMGTKELLAQLHANLESVPGIKGVNNHMGSKLTTDAKKMDKILTVLKKRNLFFIDSRTTKDTIARSSAEHLKIPFAQRNVFLDHNTEPAMIRKEIERLVRIATAKGVAVGIGHPYKATLKVLRQQLPQLKKKVRLVPASAVVGIVG
jgi:uncharacterized protein